MRKALRPCVTVAVALVGASVIAVAPVIATPPDVKIANPDVQLSASPLDEFVEALQEALDNVQAVIGRALMSQTSPLTAEQVLGTLAGETGGNLKLVHDVQALPRFRGANIPAILDRATDTVRAATNSAEAGDIPAAIADVASLYRGLSALAGEALKLPLDLMDPDLVRATVAALGRLQSALAGPALSSIQTPVNAVQQAAEDFQPDRDAVENVDIVEYTIGSDDLDRTVAGRADTTSTPHVAEEQSVADDSVNVEVQDPDEVGTTGRKVDATDLTDGNKYTPQLFGRNSASPRGAGPVMTTLRQGLQGFREGVRDAVKTLTGQGGAAAGAGATEAPSSPTP